VQRTKRPVKPIECEAVRLRINSGVIELVLLDEMEDEIARVPLQGTSPYNLAWALDRMLSMREGEPQSFALH
jgi:hypothetical protein